MADKGLERRYLEELRAVLFDFPPGEINCGESPDFIVQSVDRTVGIEVTVFHLPPEPGNYPPQKRQALKDSIVARAHRSHTAEGGPPLNVSVYFERSLSVVQREIGIVADGVARAVLECTPPASLDAPTTRLWDGLPLGVRQITVHASWDGNEQRWSAEAGGLVAPVQPHHIEEVVRRKREMAEVAKSKCDELWLVVVNDFIRAAPAEIDDNAAHHTYSHHPFDRLLWLEPIVGRVRILPSS